MSIRIKFGILILIRILLPNIDFSRKVCLQSFNNLLLPTYMFNFSFFTKNAHRFERTQNRFETRWITLFWCDKNKETRPDIRQRFQMSVSISALRSVPVWPSVKSEILELILTPHDDPKGRQIWANAKTENESNKKTQTWMNTQKKCGVWRLNFLVLLKSHVLLPCWV